MSFLFSQRNVPDGGCSCVHLSLFSVTALTMFRQTSLQKLNKVLQWQKLSYEPRCEKMGLLRVQKQRHRSAMQKLHS